eukprot:5819764-Ditylum_brightwellii.AAC.1
MIDVPYPLSCFEEPHAQWIEYVQDNDSEEDDDEGGMKKDDLPSSNTTTQFLTNLDNAVQKAVEFATGNDTIRRVNCPLSSLTLALQCGGSDSFSGLTGNPLAGDISSHLLHMYGTKSILAESPELIGAEPYILSNVSSHNVASKFIQKTEGYKAFAEKHDQSAAGNPSGGNLYRGLYNIVLKSLGAARKKAPDVTLDCVLDYGEPMMTINATTSTSKSPNATEKEAESKDDDDKGGPPFYAFMDSPGNDLESIAGQVASRCNLILFITGNGALTNFPFVPTIKIVTTSTRFNILKDEMDIDAGPYGDENNDVGSDVTHSNGSSRQVVEKATELCLDVASGRKRSKGELAGHYQVSIWRNWALDPGNE